MQSLKEEGITSSTYIGPDDGDNETFSLADWQMNTSLTC